MSKKWNSRAPSAFSSAFAVLILLSAGAAVAQQGGLQQLAAGAKDAMQGNDHSAAAMERRAALLASPVPAPAHGHGADGSVRPNGDTADPGDACAITVAGVRADMPAADDATGIAHAVTVLQANCGKNPQAHGLINALEKIGHGKGHTEGGHGGGPPPGHTNNGGGGGGGKPTDSGGGPPPGHTNSGGGPPPGHTNSGGGPPPGHTNSGGGGGEPASNGNGKS